MPDDVPVPPDDALDQALKALYVLTAALGLWITIDLITDGYLTRQAALGVGKVRAHFQREEHIRREEARTVFEAMEIVDQAAQAGGE